ncbi:hypothetical protein [Micromonospora sp. NPDC005206]|uniref:hypothetical protein n=1 Tax=Micromonospora sp. NPDC005206 TaxID=3157022 RepID=UPI0033B343AE
MSIDLESLDTVLVGTGPTALVLHSSGVAIGYAFFAPEFVLLVKVDGSEIIKTTEENLDVWLERLSANLGRAVAIWE